MICPRCGKENPDENEFCYYCRAKLKTECSDMDDSDTFETIGNQEKPVKNKAMQSRKKPIIKKEKAKRNNLIVMIGSLLFIAALFYFSFL